MQPPVNDGTKVYTLLVEYNVRTGNPTGRVKPNVPSDPNYIPPVEDLINCPLPGEPVIPYRDVQVQLLDFEINVKLQYSTLYVERNTSGNWNVVDRTYDGVLFEVTDALSAPFILKVSYNNNASFKQVTGNGIGNYFIPGPFPALFRIEVLTIGDYNNDYSDDFYN